MKKITIHDLNYPKLLKKIADAPKELYLDGNINLLKSNCIAIIGSRHASENGKKIAEKFATELSQVGITVVSGLAIGIDTVAHTFSHNHKGKTIAVLGCGFNKIFPKENKDLYKKILDNGGLVISEYPPDTEPSSHNFNQRNRIISGISLGLLVIEAQYRSGTGITAKFAKKQKRPIFALPHEIWDKNGVGTNRLLKNGATLVTDTSDILRKLKLSNCRKLYYTFIENNEFENVSALSLRNMFSIENSNSLSSIIPSKNSLSNIIKSQDNKMPLNKTKKSNLQTESKAIAEIIFNNINDKTIYKLIYNLSYSLEDESNNQISAVSVNDLCIKSGYSVSQVQSILFSLEINGYIKKVSGGYVCI